MTYYEYYDLPATLEVDQKALKRLYYQKSREVHPDFYGQEGQEALDQSLDQATFNNNAYKCLKNRDLRIKYILNVFSGTPLSDTSQPDPMFLMEMMEVNEKMMEATPEEVDGLTKEIMDRDEEAYSALHALQAKLFEEFEEKDWDALRNYYFQRRYLLRLINNLDNLAAR